MSTGAVRMREEWDNLGQEDAPAPLLIHKRRPLVDCQGNQLQQVIRNLAYRKLTTIVSSAGGTGKSTTSQQLAVEMELGLPIFGCDELIPYGRRVLYLNAEDQLQAIDFWLSRILPHYDLAAVPFDIFPVCETESGEFPLTGFNVDRLIDLINAEQYDLLIIDTAIGVLPDDVPDLINATHIRRFLRRSCGAIQRQTNCAILMLAHDNRAKQALSGTVDWANFGRLVLHLEETNRANGKATLNLTHVKDNVGFPYRKLTLTRDLQTLTSTVTDIERRGDEKGTVAGPEDIDRLLARLVRFEVMSLAAQHRTKEAVIALLFRHASPHGVRRQQVRDFFSTKIRTEDRKIGRTNAIVVTGLREDPENVGGDDR